MNIGLLHINWKLKTAVLQWKYVQTSERWPTPWFFEHAIFASFPALSTWRHHARSMVEEGSPPWLRWSRAAHVLQQGASWRRGNVDLLPNPPLQHMLLDSRFLWPGMNKDVGFWALTCLDCQKTMVARHMRPPVRCIDVLWCCFSHIHIDLVGPPLAVPGYTHIFTVMDWSLPSPGYFHRHLHHRPVSANFLRREVCHWV